MFPLLLAIDTALVSTSNSNMVEIEKWCVEEAEKYGFLKSYYETTRYQEHVGIEKRGGKQVVAEVKTGEKNWSPSEKWRAVI